MYNQDAEGPNTDVVLAAVTQKYLIVTCNQAARRLGVTKLQGVTGMSSCSMGHDCIPSNAQLEMNLLPCAAQKVLLSVSSHMD